MKFRRAVRLLFSPAELKARNELEKVRRRPRYTPGWTTLFNRPFRYADSSSYFFMHEEIFAQEVYAFDTDNPTPRIIDGGANVGLSAIYFKRRFPAAQITAFEADRNIAAMLLENLDAQGMSDVEVCPAALWKEGGQTAFVAEGADSGRVKEHEDQFSRSETVKAVYLGDVLCDRVDYLKLDIEGAETDVVISCGSKIQRAKRIFIEYHSHVNLNQRLHELLHFINSNGYRYYIQSPSPFTKNPFQEVKTYAGFDMAVNIYAAHADLHK